MAHHSIDEQQTTRFLTAIGDPKRLQILFTLGNKRLKVGEIAATFNISRPAVSHHLKVLKDAGVLQNEKVGQEVYYWMDTDFVVSELRSLADEVEKMGQSE